MTNRTTHTNGRNRGFSLMELLAVMAIMALLTTLAVTSYFGAVRGMTRRSAIKHFANTLILARQRACMDNARMSVVVFNEITGIKNTDVTPAYVLCREIGRISLVKDNGNKLVDEFTEIEKIFGTEAYGEQYKGSIKLYNLTQGKWSNIYPWVEPEELNNRMSASGNPLMTTYERVGGYSINAFTFRVNPNAQNNNEATWKVGDSYGIEAAPQGSLPRNFWFENLGNNTAAAIAITFKPDGTAVCKPSGSVRIKETQPPNKSSTVSVSSDGTVSFNEDWR